MYIICEISNAHILLFLPLQNFKILYKTNILEIEDYKRQSPSFLKGVRYNEY